MKISSEFVIPAVLLLLEYNYVSGAIYPSSGSESSSFLSLLNNFNPFVRECSWLFRENPEDCQSYFQCRHGQSVLRRCPRQLAWNKEGGYCDWEYRAKCKAEKRKKGQNETKKKPKDSCRPNTYAPHETSCEKFYSCDGSGVNHLMDCPPGLLYDPVLCICNWPFMVQCSPSSGGGGGGSVPMGTTTSTTSTTTTSATTTTSRPTASWTTTTSTLAPFFSTDPTTSPTTTTTTTALTTTTTRPSTTTTATAKPSTVYPILIPSTDFIVVCYFASWATYRQNGGKFTPSMIDPSKCTHIIYAFAIFSPTTFEMQMFDEYVDGKDGLDYYGQITAFQKYGITPIIAIGGWEDSGSLKWNELFSDFEKMQKFIYSVKPFLQKYGFKGIDIDVEYPGCLQGNCAANHAHHREAFSVLIKGLKQELGDEYTVTVAISCNENIVKVAYDIRTISKYVSWLNVMTYDYHGPWEKRTGHVAPLYPNSDKDPQADLTVQHSIEMLLGYGVPREKICLGFPAYGTSFTLADAQQNGLGAPVVGPGEAGTMTRAKGMLSNGEICKYDFQVVVKNPQNRYGPYRVKNKLWVSHDDQDMIKKKSDFILEYGLKGAMVWSIDLDDFQGYCGKEKFFCLSIINKIIRGPKGTVYTHKWRKYREAEEKKRKQRKSRSRSRRRRF